MRFKKYQINKLIEEHIPIGYYFTSNDLPKDTISQNKISAGLRALAIRGDILWVRKEYIKGRNYRMVYKRK